MDGKYVSFYGNGNKKAEGNFRNNRRTGKWEVWDSTGKMHITHVVKSDSLARNANGYFEPVPLHAADVLVEKRVWRNAYKEHNALLFKSSSLFDTLYTYIMKDSLVIYKDEEFTTTKSKEWVKENFPVGKFEIVDLKIKEDWFFDKRTNAAEVRQVGIYPFLRPLHSENEENMSLGWIFFPQAVKILASQKTEDKHFPEITSLADVFWYRHFLAEIYKEANVYDRPIASYAKSPEAAALEAERIEIDLIEMEHRAWLYGEKAFVTEEK